VRDGARYQRTLHWEGGTLSVRLDTSSDWSQRCRPRACLSDEGEGDAGDLTIATRRLLLRDGAQVSATSFSTGEGGTLSVTASDTVEVIGRSVDGRLGSGLYAQTEGEGDAGDLTIATRRLLLRDGAQVSAGTFGTGEGGTLSVSASDTVEVIGTSADGQYPSALFADTEGEGNAGDLTIATRRLLLRDGHSISWYYKHRGGRDIECHCLGHS
jgi:large exoprotein involved in heme utilization and adhesion